MMLNTIRMFNWLCLLALSFVTSNANIITLFGQDIFVSEVEFDGFVDTGTCYADLEQADSDGDRRISPSEYVDFIFLTESSLDFETFEQLPLEIQSRFNFLACLCEDFPGATDNSCCQGVNAGLETAGAFSGETPTPDQEVYLYTVCVFTQTGINRVLNSDPPSNSPSSEPSQSPSTPPTPSPTEPTRLDATVSYLIGVRGVTTQEADYTDILKGAMNSLAPQVLAEVRRRHLTELSMSEGQHLRRNLRTVTDPTAIAKMTTVGEYKYTILNLLCNTKYVFLTKK